MSSRHGRPFRTGVFLTLLAAGAMAGGPARAAAPGSAAGVRVSHDRTAVTVTVPRSKNAPGYSVRVGTGALSIATARGGRTVLATAGGTTGALRFRSGGTWQRATTVTGWSWRDGVLRLTARTTAPGAVVTANLTPKADRYELTWQVTGGAPDALGLAYDLRSAGHWYGHGEASTPNGGPYTDQPWPLDAGDVHDTAFGPASYQVVDPFWYTSSATGLLVNTGEVMDVAINDGGDHLGRFTIDSAGPYDATVFVERTPRDVYRDHTGVVGKPAKSDATYTQYEKPLWNSWAQFYTDVDQAKLLDYAQKLHDDGIPGHTIQVDDRWESEYGNLTFDTAKFPDARAMSDRIHALGYDFGLWVTLWINLDSANYTYAADHGYLLKDAHDPSKPCTVTWWNGTAGIVDLANPDAVAWYTGNLSTLMSTYRVDGFKFDTRFFDDTCAPDPGKTRADYQRLGAQLADRYDLQGAGIRVHWSGSQQTGFVIRQVDKGTGWNSLAAAVAQNLAISTIGYPFVETDMVGGSLGQPPPTKQVLIRWAQAAALMPLMYSSTSPAGTIDHTTGRPYAYDAETIARYRDAVREHGRLAPYIWAQVENSVATGDPIMRPLFFDFPKDAPGYTVNDEWMLGPAVLAAPMLAPGDRRDVFLPSGTWYDVNHRTTIRGPRTLRGYAAPLGVTPAFVDLRAAGAATALRALKRG